MMLGNRLVKLFYAKIFQRLSSDPIKIHIDCHRDTFYLYLSLSHLNFSSVFNAIFHQRQELVWKFTLLDFLFLFVCSCLQAKTRRGKSGPTLPRAPHRLQSTHCHLLRQARDQVEAHEKVLNLSYHPPQHLWPCPLRDLRHLLLGSAPVSRLSNLFQTWRNIQGLSRKYQKNIFDNI